jgi:hypothetical protein
MLKTSIVYVGAESSTQALAGELMDPMINLDTRSGLHQAQPVASIPETILRQDMTSWKSSRYKEMPSSAPQWPTGWQSYYRQSVKHLRTGSMNAATKEDTVPWNPKV